MEEERNPAVSEENRATAKEEKKPVSDTDLRKQLKEITKNPDAGKKKGNSGNAGDYKEKLKQITAVTGDGKKPKATVNREELGDKLKTVTKNPESGKKSKAPVNAEELEGKLKAVTKNPDAETKSRATVNVEELGNKLKKVTGGKTSGTDGKQKEIRIRLGSIPAGADPVQTVEALDAAAVDSKGHFYRPSIKRLRLILMFLLCIDLFGFPTAIGPLIQKACGFVPIAFFILSGYLVLRDDENRPQRIKSAIKRTAMVFGILTVVYFILNMFYYRLVAGESIFTYMTSLRSWFSFLVLNIWPFDIGAPIWYVQSMLYAYIIIFVLDKLKLLRFDWIIAILCLIVTVLTGELAGVINFNVLGYTYIAGNFLTRALPYILIGCLIHRKSHKLLFANGLWYAGGIVVGVILTLLEILILNSLGVKGYYAHVIGMPITAFSVCMIAIRDYSDRSKFDAFFGMSRWHINLIYYLCSPVSILLYVITILCGIEVYEAVGAFFGLITFVVCFLVAWGIAWLASSAEKTDGDTGNGNTETGNKSTEPEKQETKPEKQETEPESKEKEPENVEAEPAEKSAETE